MSGSSFGLPIFPKRLDAYSTSLRFTTLFRSHGPAIDTRVQGSAVAFDVLGQAPDRRAVIQWSNVRPINHSTNNHRRFHFQLVLHEGTNVIEYRYGDTLTSGYVPTAASASVGIENHNASSGADLLGCSPACDGRPRPARPDGFPQNSMITLTP